MGTMQAATLCLMISVEAREMRPLFLSSTPPPSDRMVRAIKRAKDVPEGILRRAHGFWYPQSRDRWMDAVAPTTPAALSMVLLRCAHMSLLTLEGWEERERNSESERERETESRPDRLTLEYIALMEQREPPDRRVERDECYLSAFIID